MKVAEITPQWRCGSTFISLFVSVHHFVNRDFNLRSGLDVWNCSSSCLLAGSVVIALILAVPTRILFVVGVVASHPIVSHTSSPASGVTSTCQKWRFFRRNISFLIV